MKPKFACADFTFPLLTHDKVLDLIALLEFEGVDIGLFQDRSHIQPSTEFTDVSAKAHLLKNKLDDRGIKAADIFLQTATDFAVTAINHPDASVRSKVRDAFLKTLEYTSICEGRHVSGLPGVHFETESYESSFARCCDELSWRAEKARMAGIVFGVECHVGSIASDPETALKLVQSVPGLTLTLDYTHFTRLGIPDARVEPLVTYASHFHARGAAFNRLQTPVSESEIDYPAIVRKMKETGYKGYVGIEYIWMEWENCNRVDNISECILLRDLMRKEFERGNGNGTT